MRQKAGIALAGAPLTGPFRGGVFFVATSKNVIDASCGWVGSTAEGRRRPTSAAWLLLR